MIRQSREDGARGVTRENAKKMVEEPRINRVSNVEGNQEKRVADKEEHLYTGELKRGRGEGKKKIGKVTEIQEGEDPHSSSRWESCVSLAGVTGCGTRSKTEKAGK